MQYGSAKSETHEARTRNKAWCSHTVTLPGSPGLQLFQKVRQLGVMTGCLET